MPRTPVLGRKLPAMLEQPVVGKAGERGVHRPAADAGLGREVVAVAPAGRIRRQRAQQLGDLSRGVSRSAHGGERSVSRYILSMNRDEGAHTSTPAPKAGDSLGSNRA